MDRDIIRRKYEDPENLDSRTFAVVFPHSDDISIFSAGLVLKLLKDGARGFFIRVTNDEMDSFDLSPGETMYRIEKETREVIEFLGLTAVIDLNYKNHYLNHNLVNELRHRLIILFRHLKVDTVISFDPWGHYEENPDHYITGMATEQACWMSGRHLDLPELSFMGFEPHFVKEKYYVARGPQLVNYILNIEEILDKKLKAIALHTTPVDNMFREHLNRKNKENIYLNSEEYIKAMFSENYEKYHYIGDESQ